MAFDESIVIEQASGGTTISFLNEIVSALRSNAYDFKTVVSISIEGYLDSLSIATFEFNISIVENECSVYYYLTNINVDEYIANHANYRTRLNRDMEPSDAVLEVDMSGVLTDSIVQRLDSALTCDALNDDEDLAFEGFRLIEIRHVDGTVEEISDGQYYDWSLDQPKEIFVEHPLWVNFQEKQFWLQAASPYMVKGCYVYKVRVATFAQHQYRSSFGVFNFDFEVIVLDQKDSEDLQKTICGDETSSDPDTEPDTEEPDPEPDTEPNASNTTLSYSDYETVQSADFKSVISEMHKWLEPLYFQMAYQEMIQLQLGPSASQFGQMGSVYEDFALHLEVSN